VPKNIKYIIYRRMRSAKERFFARIKSVRRTILRHGGMATTYMAFINLAYINIIYLRGGKFEMSS